ncbi:hypothetical protein NM208_g13899 [Fusarium decemcellulare]|uniref:Uncharacterized protein n=1 Tax=Fusarium decemcellulare TaxID=57161 RepID=A0ACC1RK18_9HYPO|nr:hypothetical protein NM208_g13899 [Fusarium decemcellulare]
MSWKIEQHMFKSITVSQRRILVVEDFGFRHSRTVPASPRKQGWLYRILRSTSSQPTPGVKPVAHHARHKRSVSDLAHSLVGHRRETPKALDLQSMVRLSGKSTLYLPSEHAPSALILPTSLRATAHHIAQHVTTRGIFRIPGSIRVVNALFDYYCCTDHGNVDIAGTVRSANLPMHIEASVHDVASAFKRLLSVIPGGILGSVSLFDALVSIHSQLQGDPEFPRTKQTKVRARLIALAIATVESHFRRDLICAVFGLLSLIGRVAEITPREDEEGRPLPTGDLMGYSALGIVFGPLLLGDLLGFYTMQLAAPKAGLLVLPSRSPKPRQDRHRRKTLEAKSLGPPTVDKIFIANRITEMLITNWRDVVRQMKSLGLHRRDPLVTSQQIDSLEQDESESFVIKKPQGWDQIWRSRKREEEARRVESPGPDTPTLGVSRHRPRNRSGSTPNRPGTQPGIGVLSPTAEESAPDDETLYEALSQMRHSDTSERSDRNRGHGQETVQQERRSHAEPVGDTTELRHAHGHVQTIGTFGAMEPPVSTPAGKGRETTLRGSPRVSLEDVPPRTSSKPRLDVGQPQRASTEDHASTIVSCLSGPDPVTDPSGALATDPLNSPPTHREFSSEHEALEAALKAHSEELKRLGSPEYQNNSSLSHRSRQSSGSTYIETQSKQSTQQPLDMGMDKLRQSGEYTYSTDNGVIDRLTATRTKDTFSETSIASTPRQFYAPMRVPSMTGEGIATAQGSSLPEARELGNIQTKQNPPSRDQELSGAHYSILRQQQAGPPVRSYSTSSGRFACLLDEPPEAQPLPDTSPPGPSMVTTKRQRGSTHTSGPQVESKQGSVRAMAARFEGGDQSTGSSPACPRSKSRTQSLISHFSQSSPTKTVRSSRSVSALGHSMRNPSLSSQNTVHSRNPSAGTAIQTYQVPELQLQASIGEEAALRAVELQNEEKQLKPSPTYHGNPNC